MRPRKKITSAAAIKYWISVDIGKVYRQEATEDETGEDPQTAKGSDGRVVDFPGIRHIEQLFHLRYIDHGRNCQERDRKRNSY